MSIRRNNHVLLFIALYTLFLCNTKNFVTITNQVELTVEDRVNIQALYKFSLIDLDLLMAA